MRLFAAIALPEALSVEVEKRVAPVKADLAAKWSPVAHLHLTLVFLGTTPLERFDHITRALDEAAKQAKPFQLEVQGAGTFGERVLWLGLGGDLDTARRIQAHLQRGLEMKSDYDQWSPHITLARGGPSLVDAATRLSDVQLGPFTVSELTLFESLNGEYLVRHRSLL